MAFLRAVDATQTDTFWVVVVQDFDGVDVEDGDNGAGEVSSLIRLYGEPGGYSKGAPSVYYSCFCLCFEIDNVGCPYTGYENIGDVGSTISRSFSRGVSLAGDSR